MIPPDNRILIHRTTHNSDVKEYLFLYSKKIVHNTPAKRWSSHGELKRTGMEGNGYHGICANCGLPLDISLGYNSWDGTVCEVPVKIGTEIVYTIGWTKSYKRAKCFIDKVEARKYQNDLIHKQGWGKYNYQQVEWNGL